MTQDRERLTSFLIDQSDRALSTERGTEKTDKSGKISRGGILLASFSNLSTVWVRVGRSGMKLRVSFCLLLLHLVLH